ncbi:hypothetical protein BDZ91DRAFT_102432 [Kalaharituber pfeilii]|nr:hypothetical protein BDZ91DRAFT_102432 [Kalaharituber pfeilii]
MSSGSNSFYTTSGSTYANRPDIPTDCQHRSHASTTGSPSSASADNDLDDAGRNAKRTPKACDRCRHKKTKCTGESPCQRCRLDNTVCSYTNRRPKEGPNFNPQVAQKDAAMSMLYKCIEIMNRQLLNARLGPYTDAHLATYADSEDFIIGVILDRFGVSPVLDEFDNQPVYLPGQRGFNPETCVVDFPHYSRYSGVIEDDSRTRDSNSYGSPLALPRSLNPVAFGEDISMTDRDELPPRLKKQRTTPAEMTSPPELEQNYGYESSPDESSPVTPKFSTMMGIDCQFDYRELISGTPPPPPRQHSYTYGQQGCPTQENSSAWGHQKQLDEPLLAQNLLPTDMECMDSFTHGQFASKAGKLAQPAAQSQQIRQTASHSAYMIQQAQIDRIRREQRIQQVPHVHQLPRCNSPAQTFPGLNKTQIPLPAHIMQAVEMEPVTTQWDFPAVVTTAGSGGVAAYPSTLCSAGMSPEISALRLGSARHSPSLRAGSLEALGFGGFSGMDIVPDGIGVIQRW